MQESDRYAEDIQYGTTTLQDPRILYPAVHEHHPNIHNGFEAPGFTDCGNVWSWESLTSGTGPVNFKSLTTSQQLEYYHDI